MVALSQQPPALIRVNQAGYATGGPIDVAVMARSSMRGDIVSVTRDDGTQVASSPIGSGARWSPAWAFTARVQLGPLPAGTYVVHAPGAGDASITVNAARTLYARLASNAVTFFQAQRDGSDQVQGTLGIAGHQHDAATAVFAPPRYRGFRLLAPPAKRYGPVDVANGWSDAGDYLKFTYTATFSDAMLFLTARDWSAGVSDPAALRDEAAYGARWLIKMWDPARRVLHMQVGIGDGNARILGDQDLWRTPNIDDHMAAGPGARTRFLAWQPVFDANRPGQPVPPNLAGRMAGAMGLCAQVLATADPSLAQQCAATGAQVLARADLRWRGRLPTVYPAGYYDEANWRGDMQFGDIELALGDSALGAPGATGDRLLRAAAAMAARAPTHLQENLSLRDISAIGNADVAMALAHAGSGISHRASIINRMHRALTDPQTNPVDPFGLRNIAAPDDQVPHALGVAVMMRLADRMDGASAHDQIATDQLNWVLGDNAWGQSFVVGAGQQYPRCLAHQIANLRGSLDRTDPVLLGATVNGPTGARGVTGLGAPDGYRPCSDGGALRPFDGQGQRYVDDVRSSNTSEPADDYSALALLAFAQEASSGGAG